MNSNNLSTIISARLARVFAVQFMYSTGLLERADALDALDGPLTPGDEATHFDDSVLLDLPVADVYAAIWPGAQP